MAVDTDYINTHPNDDYWYVMPSQRLKCTQAIKNKYGRLKFKFSYNRRIFDKSEDSIRLVVYQKVKLKEKQYLMNDIYNGGHHVYIFQGPLIDDRWNSKLIQFHDVMNGIFTNLYTTEEQAIQFCNKCNIMLIHDIQNLIKYLDLIIKLENYLI